MKQIIFNENILKDENIVSWNNKTRIYFDKTTIPSIYKSILDLNEKCVLYYLITRSNILYIGVTTDFGQRIQSHNKDARNKQNTNKKLYKDIKLHGCAILGILDVCNNIEIGRNKEKFLIQNFKHEILMEKYGINYKFLIPKDEQEAYLFTKLYNLND